MADFDAYFEKAVETGQIPGAVAFAVNKDGKEIYSKAVGHQTLDPTTPPITDDTVFWLASMTKLMTSIAALQCVERGQIGLDDDVTQWLTEWKDVEVIDGFAEDGTPIMHTAKNKITLRTLLSHSSGMGYDLMNPKLVQYNKWKGREPGTMGANVKKGYLYPLTFEPGAGWDYGVGIDWAGQLVERLNNNIRLGTYMATHIWAPLGMTSTTFSLPSRPDLEEKLMGMTARLPDGKLIHNPTPIFPREVDDDCGGIGAYSTPADYKKLLAALVQDGKGLFKDPETVKLLRTPQLVEKGRYMMEVMSGSEELARLLGWESVGRGEVSYGLGGMCGGEGTDTGRKAPWVQWGGLPNLFWFIDAGSDIAAGFFTQVVPTGDAQTVEVFKEFERSLYRK